MHLKSLSRRAVLAGATAIIPAAATAALPKLAKAAASEDDPIFAVIREYDEAVTSVEAATAVLSDIDDQIGEAGTAAETKIKVFDVATPTHSAIDAQAEELQRAGLWKSEGIEHSRRRAHALLGDIERRRKASGYDVAAEQFNRACTLEYDRLQILVLTVPTTVAGARAFSDLIAERLIHNDVNLSREVDLAMNSLRQGLRQLAA